MSEIDHPKHYNKLPATCHSCHTQIECIDVVRHMGFNLGNVIKYVWRADYKGNDIDDLEKALWYIKDEIERRKGAVKRV